MQRSIRRTSMAAAVVLALATALTFATVSAAGATPPDLSTPAAINAYLVSIGVNPADAVWQETHKNYAGPGCPGAGWNCVPATTPIVQVADAGGTNLFACGGLDCVVVQVALSGGQNGAGCLRGDNQSSNQVQLCEITQANAGNPNSTNAAAIAQNIQQSSGSTQTARQVARITQDNTLGRNVAHIHQVIGQSQNAKNAVTITQAQEAHQGATVDQLTTEGDNSSSVTQRQGQSQRATKAVTSITQDQNTTVGGDPLCDRPGDVAFDQAKNQCAEVAQNSNVLPPEGGSLDSSLRQLTNETQTASSSPLIDQGQGFFNGGQSGEKDQLSSGVATSEADQDTFQTQTATGVPASGLIQTQTVGDPRCCQEQGTNSNDTADIDQSTTQNASSPDAVQNAEFVGTCLTTGTCHVMQSSTIDGETNTNECTGSSCDEVFICTSGEGETFCFEGGVD